MQKETLQDKIAIRLPVFNSSKYLEPCLQSIFNQTFTNFIIFAINDGSTDESGNILDKYASLDPRIKVVHKKNEGVSAARNYALDLIEMNDTFNYISFVDSDDVLSPNFLKLHLESIKRADADVSICGFLFIAEDGSLHQLRPTLSKRAFNGDEYINLIFSKNEWSNGNGAGGMVWKQIYRANAIQGIRFPKDPSVQDDEIYGVMVAQRAKLFVYIPEALYFYRQSSNSLCKDKNFQISRLNGRKMCVNNCQNLTEEVRLVIFASYIESVLSLMKKDLVEIELAPYTTSVDRAYNLGAMKTKTFLLFYLFKNCSILAKCYIYLRKGFKKFRGFLRLRV